jgi:hypothetical protein
MKTTRANPTSSSVRLGWRALQVTVALTCLVAAPPAYATLGGDVSTVVANHASLGGTVQITALGAVGNGERHELSLPSGVVVREYVAKGSVYAISWSGARPPDLRELLGSYFPKLSRATGVPGSHHRMILRGEDFSVDTMAHRGSFAGRAWVPSLVPAGVDVGALR